MHSRHPVTDYESVVGGGAQFIDVREPDEVAKGTLPGTTNIPLGDLPAELANLDLQRRVVVLCRSGARSKQAAEILTRAGFVDVVNLDGGMAAWTKAAKKGASRGGLLSRFRRGPGKTDAEE